MCRQAARAVSSDNAATMDGYPLLEARALTVRRGERLALDAVHAAFGAGELVGLIGAAGAGKTTLVGALSGHVAPSGGEVFALGARLTGAPAALFARHGVARLDSTRGAAAAHEALAQLERLLLARGGGGDGTSACDTAPRVLLLDGLAAGLDAAGIVRLDRVVRRLRDELEVTVIRAEIAGAMPMRELDRAIVLHEGRKIADGTPGEVARNAQVGRLWPVDELMR